MNNILDFTSLYFKTEPEKLHPEAYIFRNFLNAEEVGELQNHLKDRAIDHNGNVPLPELDAYRTRIVDLFNKKIEIDKIEYATAHDTGGMGLHTDKLDWHYELLKMIVDKSNPVKKQKIRFHCYTFLFYLNDDFEGGEISYPEYKVDYKPSAGDLIIHTTDVIHGVKKIKSGMRYRCQGLITDDFYVDYNKFHKFDFPDDKDYTGYSFTIDETKSERLAKFKESYIEEDLY